MLQTVGHLLFRRRNVLFPLAFVALLLAAPPRPFGTIGWDLLALAGLLAVASGQALRVIAIGLDYIKRGGRDGRVAADRLVSGGLYAHTRNPMYLGNLLVVWGVLAVSGRPATMFVGGALFALAYAAIVAGEEAFLARRFGRSYAEYCAAVPRWRVRLPGMFATLRGHRFDWPGVVVKEYGTLFLTTALLVVVVAWKLWRGEGLERVWPLLAAALAVATFLYGWARWLKKRRGWAPRGTDAAAAQGPGQAAIEAGRRRIDRLDRKILVALNARAREVTAIFELKRSTGRERVDSLRIEAVLAGLERANRGPLSGDDVRDLHGAILRFFSYRFASVFPPEHLDPATDDSDDGTAPRGESGGTVRRLGPRPARTGWRRR